MLTQQELHAALVCRHGAAIQSKIDRATIGIAGLGGLGSNIAVLLARLGVGHLVLVDFDKVDITNLHRQHYTMDDLGVPKAQALKKQLIAINPYLNYETYIEKVLPENAARLFAGCDIVCEAFDRADQKAMLIETLLDALPDAPIISGSGMAGYGSANAIRTEKRFSRLYLCGDGVSDISDGLGLMAPRVAVCAAHQATMALRLLLGEREP
ncbi:MAG: sulfur carrier protein ThiS adenylyltransferase ThiF [Agathobaculum sp.]|jgi:sulfur carrier protein ThiS adenylyltransferase|uniref:sulfur carrier protein ThiS adenylyltransferase ThiF n=1 Tax=Agathobaculum sp. TaxID=2048138 RepID=UPI003D8F4A94